MLTDFNDCNINNLNIEKKGLDAKFGPKIRTKMQILALFKTYVFGRFFLYIGIWINDHRKGAYLKSNIKHNDKLST